MSATQSAGGTPLAALALGVDLLDEAVLGTVRGVHDAVGGRVRAVGDLVTGHRTDPGARHRGLSGVVYDGIGRGLRGTARALRAADRMAPVAPLEDSPRGRFVLGAVNGIFGDRIAARHPELAIDLAVRRHGSDVETTYAGLRAAYPEATDRIVVFAHGLSETDEAWRRGLVEVPGESGGPGEPAAERLSYPDTVAGRGWSPLVLRWNTGLTLTENGHALARLLDEVVERWPVPVTRIAFVGHSMGGLLARRACAEAGHDWQRLVTDVVTLGTPHLGAPIARGLTSGVSVLRLLPETTPFGTLLDHRSAGVLDLRSGLPRDVRNLPHARYHLVAATLHRSPRHPLSEVAGDLLVRYPSAVGRGRRGEPLFPGASEVHLPCADHFALLNHPRVHTALEEWLAADHAGATTH